MTPKTTGKRKRATRAPVNDRRPLSKYAVQRYAAMLAADPQVSQTEIATVLAERGVTLTRSAVGFVLRGRWYNTDVARVFCDLTRTAMNRMWPEFVDENGRERTDPLTEEQVDAARKAAGLCTCGAAR